MDFSNPLHWLALAVIGIVAVEGLLCLPWARYGGSLLRSLGAAVDAFCDESSDDDVVIQNVRRTALKLLGTSLQGLGFPLVILAALWGIEISLAGALGLSLMAAAPIVLITISSVIWFFCRGRIFGKSSDSSGYGPFARALHRFAFDTAHVGRLSFELDQRFSKAQASLADAPGPVWVCGLARGGTTMLTELLYNTKQFYSLTYRHMPFVLAPNLWGRVSRWNQLGGKGQIERAHGDGVMVDLDSPEAFEEVFWQTFDSEQYSSGDTLRPHYPSSENLERFEAYLSAIGAQPCKAVRAVRYLAKNNNHLIRLPALSEAFPMARFVVPIRHPVSHAQSLLRQHQMWVERHADDTFALDYMAWLGHFEFGQAHRAFQFNERAVDGDPSRLSYWLDRWLDAHQWLIEHHNPQIVLVSYARLTESPLPQLDALYRHLGLEVSNETLERNAARVRQTPIPAAQSGEHLNDALKVYEALLAKCISA